MNLAWYKDGKLLLVMNQSKDEIITTMKAFQNSDATAEQRQRWSEMCEMLVDISEANKQDWVFSTTVGVSTGRSFSSGTGDASLTEFLENHVALDEVAAIVERSKQGNLICVNLNENLKHEDFLKQFHGRVNGVDCGDLRNNGKQKKFKTRSKVSR